MLDRIASRRREKCFGDGRPMPLDRNGKVRLATLARVMMRRTEKGRAYGAITAKALAVLEALLWGFHNAKDGRCFPSYATIAEKAGCAVSTVGEAIRMLERAGLLTWCNRLVRVRVHCPLIGWRKRVFRTSNAYAFPDPATSERSTPMPSRPRLRSGTETPRRTTTQHHSSIGAPCRRGSDAEDSALAAALDRWRNALHHNRVSIPMAG